MISYFKADAKSSTLSGGMKRKLCVGIALCGNSKIVMLDEPTAGMDPSARRALWELIQSEKQGECTIPLSFCLHMAPEIELPHVIINPSVLGRFF